MKIKLKNEEYITLLNGGYDQDSIKRLEFKTNLNNEVINNIELYKKQYNIGSYSGIKFYHKPMENHHLGFISGGIK